MAQFLGTLIKHTKVPAVRVWLVRLLGQLSARENHTGEALSHSIVRLSIALQHLMGHTAEKATSLSLDGVLARQWLQVLYQTRFALDHFFIDRMQIECCAGLLALPKLSYLVRNFVESGKTVSNNGTRDNLEGTSSWSRSDGDSQLPYQQPSKTEIASCSSKRSKDALHEWYKRYNELVDYREQVGHCKVPQTYPPDPALGIW